MRYTWEFVDASDETDEKICDDDWVISSNGFKLSVGNGLHFLGEFVEDTDAATAIAERMNRDQFWPNVWYISDHGNVDLCRLVRVRD